MGYELYTGGWAHLRRNCCKLSILLCAWTASLFHSAAGRAFFRGRVTAFWNGLDLGNMLSLAWKEGELHWVACEMLPSTNKVTKLQLDCFSWLLLFPPLLVTTSFSQILLHALLDCSTGPCFCGGYDKDQCVALQFFTPYLARAEDIWSNSTLCPFPLQTTEKEAFVIMEGFPLCPCLGLIEL